MKTYHLKEKEIKREWHLVDAKDQVLGRLSTKVARILMGKNKVSYSPHVDLGDYVVVVNASKFRLTGKKSQDKVYRGHSGYPGGFKEVSIKKLMDENPKRIVEHAIEGMLPKNRLHAKRMKRLKIFEGEENPYKDKFDKKV